MAGLQIFASLYIYHSGEYKTHISTLSGRMTHKMRKTRCTLRLIANLQYKHMIETLNNMLQKTRTTEKYVRRVKIQKLVTTLDFDWSISLFR